MRDAGIRLFPQFRGVDSGRAGKRKARWEGVSASQRVAASRRAELEARCAASLGGRWRAYGLVMWVDERRSGTPGLGLWGTLRRALRGGSGAGVRERLGWPQNGVPSRPYRGVLGDSKEGSRNLTGGLTPDLTASLTGYLTSGLTFSGVPRVRAGRQTLSGRQGEAVATLGLGSLQGFGHD